MFVAEDDFHASINVPTRVIPLSMTKLIAHSNVQGGLSLVATPVKRCVLKHVYVAGVQAGPMECRC